jgi:hypothetical protein
MRKRLISAILTASLITGATTFAAAVSGCSGCSSTARQTLILADSSGCGGNGGSTKPANIIEANCTRDFEGPDNSPGKVTAWITFTCSTINLDAVTLVISIWHGGGGSSSVGDKPEASETCDSIETGQCTVTVTCTEGPYRAAFSLTATVDGTLVTDSAQSDKVTYSTGDCSV